MSLQRRATPQLIAADCIERIKPQKTSGRQRQRPGGLRAAGASYNACHCDHNISTFRKQPDLEFGLRSLQVQSFEPELLFEAIAKAGFEQRLLKGGQFRGRLDRLYLPRCTLDRGSYSLPCFARGAIPAGWTCIGLTHCVAGSTWFNGRSIDATHLQVYAEGAPIDYRTSPASPWYTMQVRRDDIQQFALSLTGDELPIPPRGVLNLHLPSSAASRVHSVFEAALQARERGPGLKSKQRATRMEERLWTTIVTAVACAAHESDGRTKRSIVLQARLMDRLETFLKNRLDAPFLIRDVAAATGTSERSLEKLVDRIYGVSPTRLVMIAKLHRVRSALASPSAARRSIRSIAAAWGIEHAGRFAARYEQLFNEQPHETLHRHNDAP